MTRQLACAFGVFLSTSVAAQCKADFVSTDKAPDVRAALACWKDRYETKASELDKTIAKLKETATALDAQKAKGLPIAGGVNVAGQQQQAKISEMETERRRLQAEVARLSKASIETPRLFSLQSNPFDPRKSNCFVAATRVLTDLKAHDIESDSQLSISGTLESHRVEITCWLNDLIIVTAAGRSPFPVVDRVNKLMEKHR